LTQTGVNDCYCYGPELASWAPDTFFVAVVQSCSRCREQNYSGLQCDCIQVETLESIKLLGHNSGFGTLNLRPSFDTIVISGELAKRSRTG
jgi:hypothetical protein